MTHERRGAPRANADIPIRLGAGEATLKNISISGLACHFGEPLDEMALMGIDMQLPGETAAHRFEGVVVRCDKIRGVSPPTYEVAIYFTEVEAGARAAIGRYVERNVSAASARNGGD